MRVRYDREVDILMCELTDEPIEYAEEAGPIIVHFTKDGRPVMLEILDASKFITETVKVAMTSKGEVTTEISI